MRKEEIRRTVELALKRGVAYLDMAAMGRAVICGKSARNFEEQPNLLRTDHTGKDFVSCIDEEGNYRAVMDGGIWGYILYEGFAAGWSHSPSEPFP